MPELFCENPALGSHGNLLNIIHLIKAEPNTSPSQLPQKYLTVNDDAEKRLLDPAGQRQTFNIAVRLLLIVNRGLSHRAIEVLENSQLSSL